MNLYDRLSACQLTLVLLFLCFGMRVNNTDASSDLPAILQTLPSETRNQTPPFEQDAYLKASNTGEVDVFGYAIAADGNTVVVGAPWEDSDTQDLYHYSGAVYVFMRDGDTWSQQALLRASNTENWDYFGYSVAIDGDTLVVGAIYEASNATGVNGDQQNNDAYASGAAYVFVRDGTSWSQQAYLKASNTEGNDWFGWSVAVDGDTIVVSTPWEDSNATGIDGDDSNNEANDSGAAYVFVRDGTTWSQQAYLKASDAKWANEFGWSVAIDNNTVVVGLRYADSGSNNDSSGAAYIFVRAGTSWSEQERLKSDNFADGFGWSVAVDGDTVVVGEPWDDTDPNSSYPANNSGAAYIFVRAGDVWNQHAMLKASETVGGAAFGYSVAIDDGSIVVGSPYEGSDATGVNNEGEYTLIRSGAAYVFVNVSDVWSQQAYLKASDVSYADYVSTDGDEFGTSVAVSGDLVVVGAPYEDSNATGINGDDADNSVLNSGAAYVFKSPPPLLVELSSDSVSVQEGNIGTAPTTLNLLVQGLDTSSMGSRTIELLLTDGTATVADDDYSQTTTTIMIPAADYTSVQSISIDIDVLGIVGDVIFEPDETFSATLSTPGSGVQIADVNGDTFTTDTAAITISSDDASSNLLNNPTLDNNIYQWVFFGDMQRTWDNGALSWYRTGWTEPVMYQVIEEAIGNNQVIEARARFTNTSAVPKTIMLNVRNSDYSQQMICAVYLNAGESRYVTLQDVTSNAWSRIFYTIRTFDRDSVPAIQVDDTSLRLRHDLAISETTCTGAAPATNINYLLNGDFSYAGWRYWLRWGGIVGEIADEQLSLYRPNNAGIGVVFSRVYQYFPKWTHLELSLDVTNNTNNAKGLNVLLREERWSQHTNCNFTIDSGNTQKLSVRLTTSTTWGNAIVSLRPLQADGLALTIDNVSLRPVSASGNACTSEAIMPTTPTLNAISAPPYIRGEVVQFTLVDVPDDAMIALDCDADGIFESDSLTCSIMSETVTARIINSKGEMLATTALELEMMSLAETLVYLQAVAPESATALSEIATMLDNGDAQAAFDGLFALAKEVVDPVLISWLSRLAYNIQP